MTSFTPISALAGGVLIGLAAVVLMALLGRIAGVSGIVGGLFKPGAAEVPWRLAFIAGLIVAPALVWAVTGDRPVVTVNASTGVLITGGLLVGIGTRVGAGCTSGHGVCGVARLSLRSVVSTVTFIAMGMATVAVLRHVLGVF
jgi:uncharacterized membrane protein YedE/YeeE